MRDLPHCRTDCLECPFTAADAAEENGKRCPKVSAPASVVWGSKLVYS